MSDVLALGEVADVVAGIGFPKDMQGGQDGAIPVFKVGDISAAWLQGKSLLNDSRNYLSTDEAKSLGKCVPAGATVFAKIGEALRLNRRVMLGRDALVDNNVMGLVPKCDRIVPKYLYYFMQTVDLGELSRSTTVPSIRKSDVVEISVPVPALAVQGEIVAELEKQFSRLDEAVANLQRVKANLKCYKASVLKAAVEGRLVETGATLARREGRTYETGEQLLQRILEERRAKWVGKSKYKEPAPLDATPEAEPPSGWVWCNFEQLSSSERHSLKAGPFGSALKKEFYVPAGYKIYGQEQVIAGDHKFGDYYIAEEKYRELENCAVKPGDILVSLVGTTGKVLVLPEGAEAGIINPRLIKLSLNPQFVAAQYASYYLQSAPARSFFKLQAHGGTMEILNLGIVKALPVCLPPMAEQTRIVAEVDRHLSIIREVEAEVDANLQRAQALRQATLTKAFAVPA